jgi:hypothetical protein
MTRLVALVALMATLITCLPGAALASSKGRKNTALLLGAATIYSLAKGRGTQALILAGGTYYAYRRYRDSRGRVRYRRVLVTASSPRYHRRWKRHHHRR